MAGSVLSRLGTLRERYESESSTIRTKYKWEIQAAEDKLKGILSADYANKYKMKYSASLNTLEGFYNEVASVHSRTRGLRFRIYDYISGLGARPVAKGDVEGYFARLVSECRDAIMRVRSSKSVEADVQPLKIFCQGLVDLRYVRANADRLLSESSAPKSDKEDAARDARIHLERLKAQAKEAARFEKLPCYEECVKMQSELMALAAGADNKLLGREPDFDGTHRVFMGFASVDVPAADRAFATDVLGVPDSCFASSTPIYFNITDEHSTLIIRAKHSYFSKPAFRNLMRNLYFSFASHLPQNGLQFSGVECGADEAVALGIQGQLNDTLGEGAIFAPVIHKERDLMSSGGVIDKLDDEHHKRSAKYTVANDIFEYNEMYPESRQSFILFMVNNYPGGYSGTNESAAKLIHKAMGWGAKGIITVICDSIDAPHEHAATELDADEIGASVIEIDAKGGVRYDGMNASLFPTKADFDPLKYFDTLKSYYNSSEKIWLTKLLSDVERDVKSGKLKRPPFYDKLSVPLGKGDGTYYNVDLDFSVNTGFGLLLGSTGSGKSAALHSFILSLAHHYTPDEVNLYLVDFKSDSKTDASGKTAAPEFSHYKKQPGVRNLYVPHVKYLLLKSRSENALDLFDMINKLRLERARKRGALSLGNYNKREYEKMARGEKGDPLPYAVFVVDEVNNMLGGDFNSAGSMENSVITQKLTAKLLKLLTMVRSEGIGIFFAGQTTDGFNDKLLDQIGTRIAMKSGNDTNLRKLFTFKSLDEPTEILNKTTQGKALVSFEQAGKRSKRFVTFAYADKPESERAIAIAEAIRNKYPECPAPVEAGSEAVFDPFGYESYMPAVTAAEKQRMRDHLLIGMTSAASAPVYLSYSREQEAKNYFAYSSNTKLDYLERAVAFSFIKATRERGLNYSSPRVSYLAIEGDRARVFDSYFAKEPRLKGDIECVTDKRSIAEYILSLADLYKERSAMNDRGEAREFEPRLIMLRDIEWLTQGSDTSWMPSFNSAARSTPAPTVTVTVNQAELEREKKAAEEKFKQASGGAQISDRLARMAAARKAAAAGGVPTPKPTPQPEKKPDTQGVRRYTFDEVRAAVKLIFNRGNRFGIFMLASSALMPPIKSVLFEAGLYSQDYALFGSYSEYRVGKTDKIPLTSSALVAYPPSEDEDSDLYKKARLFDLPPENVAGYVYGK